MVSDELDSSVVRKEALNKWKIQGTHKREQDTSAEKEVSPKYSLHFYHKYDML
jgi:hypothetical protein